ncbi:MAG TPA: asparagine synthase (glutamine-hydrolyzing) [Patescibacteria group bacterium]|nr:asparagine synthase (glutamine-hydrolyzing) [Patescibacteria group bacterium]
MCGISGFNFSDSGKIQKMMERQKHRGPDDSGFFCTPNWSLGHNRLSIIDLSSAGHQPMFSADQRFVIVYNGELYNFQELRQDLKERGYQFRSQTDTEVIIYSYQEWGEDCLRRFNGMFSFAILDTQTQELFAARDRVGIKPFYYYQHQGHFIFASEVKAILVHDGLDTPLNWEALNIYFRLLYIPSPLTAWQNIYKLPPAHYLRVSANGKMSIAPYWRLNLGTETGSRQEHQEKIRQVFRQAVNRNLVSDRPLGVFLSGGIDSTAITGVVSEMSDKVNTFSVGFESSEESEKYNLDFLLARKTAEHFHTCHHEFVITAAEVQSNLEKASYHLDEPISNHIQAVNLLLAQHTTEQVKVVLGGDGGDELFGGYERYYYNLWADRLHKMPAGLRNNFLSRKIFTSMGMDSWLEKINLPPGVERYFAFFAQKEDQVARFLRPEINRPGQAVSWFEKRFFPSVATDNFTQQFMATDLQSWLPDESLVRSDKMSMAAGLEQRVPFLDNELIDLAFQIPVEEKVGKKSWPMMRRRGVGYQGKVIMREALRSYLPEAVLNQPKWGWFSPAAKWLRGPLKGFAAEVLSPGYCHETNEYFDFRAIQDILGDHQTKHRYGLNTIWSLMTFQLWLKNYLRK